MLYVLLPRFGIYQDVIDISHQASPKQWLKGLIYGLLPSARRCLQAHRHTDPPVLPPRSGEGSVVPYTIPLLFILGVPQPDLPECRLDVECREPSHPRHLLFSDSPPLTTPYSHTLLIQCHSGTKYLVALKYTINAKMATFPFSKPAGIND